MSRDFGAEQDLAFEATSVDMVSAEESRQRGFLEDARVYLMRAQVSATLAVALGLRARLDVDVRQ